MALSDSFFRFEYWLQNQSTRELVDHLYVAGVSSAVMTLALHQLPVGGEAVEVAADALVRSTLTCTGAAFVTQCIHAHLPSEEVRW
jgi:hypothetical protein